MNVGRKFQLVHHAPEDNSVRIRPAWLLRLAPDFFLADVYKDVALGLTLIAHSRNFVLTLFRRGWLLVLDRPLVGELHPSFAQTVVPEAKYGVRDCVHVCFIHFGTGRSRWVSRLTQTFSFRARCILCLFAQIFPSKSKIFHTAREGVQEVPNFREDDFHPCLKGDRLLAT